MPEATHSLFLDDSGTKEYCPRRAYSLNGGKTPYFVFGGLLVTPAVAGEVTKCLQALKLDCFGISRVEIKANWLRIERERRVRYLEKFNIAEERLCRFVEEVYALLNRIECTLIASVVNKAEMQEEYATPHYAPAIAYDCVLQRAQWQMESVNGFAHVMIDDMEGATPRGSQYRENLERQHKRLKLHGSPMLKGMVFNRIGNQSFSNSMADERLQLSDLIAYAVYRQFVEHGPKWEIRSNELECYEYFRKIVGKFRNNGGRVQGYGIVKMPLKNRVQWKLRKKNP